MKIRSQMSEDRIKDVLRRKADGTVEDLRGLILIWVKA